MNKIFFTVPGAVPITGDDWQHKTWLWDVAHELMLESKMAAARERLTQELAGAEVVREYHVGKNWGWGLRMWLWLHEKAGDVEIVFEGPGNLDRCLARALAEKVWIAKEGAYATCASKMEAQIKGQIEQMKLFHEAHGSTGRVTMVTV
ncbi:hypothetical protein UFOVP736_31 [uncultured Caudovirales phage]|uniref:Uncharacterized protein n=1 Tax=uncultured Caudovirales phage TaxID=2100421 RepID=A0A6J5NK54_9CAUD|nr:hypothetical protein UFOVP705_50 [uncultured Caudovirales phage]CAB5224088.1 hypothetical protein UFOVP736_31 [uncultured Caudovirales phage]